MYRPGREFRTINTDIYELRFQKNGRTDVVLISGDVVFENAFPMVWLDSRPEPEPLDLDGRRSTRVEVNDPLGRGHGVVFRKGNGEWHLRAYPTQPYFAVQAAFHNTEKRPVMVKALLLWCVGDPNTGAVSLGPGTQKSAVLQNGRSLWDGSAEALGFGRASSRWHLAAYNPDTGRSLIAGFLTWAAARNTLEMDYTDKANGGALDLFRAATVFDPPVEVSPGESVESDVLYLSIGERTPFHGLERYAALIAATNPGPPSDPFFKADTPATWNNWRQQADEVLPKGVGVLSAAIRRYYLAPYLPGTGCCAPVRFEIEQATREQTVAWLTGCALTGGLVALPDPDAAADPFRAAVVRRLTPQPTQAARPIDLFETVGPRVWSLPLETKAGAWHIVALFNWDTEPKPIAVDFGRLGLDSSAYYAVYDYWRDTYHGTANGAVTLSAPPESVTLLGLRRYVNRPMLLAVDNHFTQGALALDALEWMPETRRLRGTFAGMIGTTYSLRILCPEPYRLRDVSAPGATVRTEVRGNLLEVGIDCRQDGRITFQADFQQGP